MSSWWTPLIATAVTVAVMVAPFSAGNLRATENVLNSAFIIAVIGSLAGAYAGAYGAQKIAERNKAREQILAELRNTNAAIMVAFSICNALLSLKGQHLRSMKLRYEKDRDEIVRRHEKWKRTGEKEATVYRYMADFQRLFLSSLPIEVLQEQAFAKISPSGRVLLATIYLRQAISNLKNSLEVRNALIETHKNAPEISEEERASLYFGLPSISGHVNQEYPSVLGAIFDQTDDGIFFSKEICSYLMEHGEVVLSKYMSQFGGGAPTIAKPDFRKAEISDLIPSADKYRDWVGMFAEKDHSTAVT